MAATAAMPGCRSLFRHPYKQPNYPRSKLTFELYHHAFTPAYPLRGTTVTMLGAPIRPPSDSYLTGNGRLSDQGGNLRHWMLMMHSFPQISRLSYETTLCKAERSGWAAKRCFHWRGVSSATRDAGC